MHACNYINYFCESLLFSEIWSLSCEWETFKIVSDVREMLCFSMSISKVVTVSAIRAFCNFWKWCVNGVVNAWYSLFKCIWFRSENVYCHKIKLQEIVLWFVFCVSCQKEKGDNEFCWKSRQWDEKLQKVILCMG